MYINLTEKDTGNRLKVKVSDITYVQPMKFVGLFLNTEYSRVERRYGVPYNVTESSVVVNQRIKEAREYVQV